MHHPRRGRMIQCVRHWHIFPSGTKLDYRCWQGRFLLVYQILFVFDTCTLSALHCSSAKLAAPSLPLPPGSPSPSRILTLFPLLLRNIVLFTLHTCISVNDGGFLNFVRWIYSTELNSSARLARGVLFEIYRVFRVFDIEVVVERLVETKK